jgi:hypothetical protein
MNNQLTPNYSSKKSAADGSCRTQTSKSIAGILNPAAQENEA